MIKNLKLAGLMGVMMLAVTAYSQTSTTDGEMVDGSVYNDGQMIDNSAVYEDPLGYGGVDSEPVTSVDSTGALIIGDPYAQQQQTTYDPNFAGPQALRDNNTIYFRYDSDQIQDEYVSVMQAHAQYLRDNPDSRIIIEGHTDERGTPEYNIALGERRARAVARYMQNLGVDVNQLSIVSYGEEKPVDPGHTENSWQKNRRAVINY